MESSFCGYRLVTIKVEIICKTLVITLPKRSKTSLLAIIFWSHCLKSCLSGGGRSFFCCLLSYHSQDNSLQEEGHDHCISPINTNQSLCPAHQYRYRSSTLWRDMWPYLSFIHCRSMVVVELSVIIDDANFWVRIV